MEGYIGTLLEEARIRRGECSEPIDTVYFGGGTPSLLPPSLLRRLCEELRNILPLEHVREWSVEANPGTVSPEWLDTALEAGISRISLGMQAAQPAILAVLGRIHGPEAVSRSVALARQAGFRNLSLDVMFGIPGQTLPDWRETLDTALALAPDHLSAYGLIPEEGTPLEEDLREGRLKLPEPEEEREMYDLALRRLGKSGFEQYEISNFARPGYACRHNIGYWRQIPYLGLGLSAASMLPLPAPEGGFACLRRTNPVAFEEYERCVRHPETAAKLCSFEEVRGRDARFETLMLGLRMNEGVSEKDFETLHGVSMADCYGPVLTRLRDGGLLDFSDGCWRLTRRGMDIQNSVLTELME